MCDTLFVFQIPSRNGSDVPSRIVDAKLPKADQEILWQQQPSNAREEMDNPPLDSASHPNALLRGQRYSIPTDIPSPISNDLPA